jgi:NADH-quinone oxidoreductase subunit L
LGNYAVFIGIFTAFLTAIYSWRLFFKTFHGSYNNKIIPINEVRESPIVMLIPLFLLAIGAIFTGFIFKETFIGHHSNDFWQNSIFFLNEIKHDYIPLWLLIITPILVVVAIPISFFYFIINTKILEEFKNTNLPLYNFLLNKWYIDELYELIFIKPIKKVGVFFWKTGDQGIIDKFGPDGVSKIIKMISNKASRFQTGYIYDYAFVMLIGVSILLTYLILH